MDYRVPLKLHTLLTFTGMVCHIEEVVGRGTNSIVYRGWYLDELNQNARHYVLIKELFPLHPNHKIWRDEDGHIARDPEADEFWEIHKESFENGNSVHLQLLCDSPQLMTLSGNMNSFHSNGTLYSILGYTGGRNLQTELNKVHGSLRHTAKRMIGLLDALEAFHKSGYLHLDISPNNMMLVGQGDQERVFLIDYNSTRKVGSRGSNYLSSNEGYSAPEVHTENMAALGFASDLYSVAAIFYRCIMGRSLTLEESLEPKAPDGHDSAMLKDMPQTVRNMVKVILRKGLHTLPQKRYQSIGPMRQVFRELLDRIDCVGVTHWSLWENGKRSIEKLIKANPSLGYLNDPQKLYPVRLVQQDSLSLERYLDNMLSPAGKSGMILAQGGMGKTTLLLHTAMLQGKRYSPAATATFYIPLNGWNKADTRYIRSQILMQMRFKAEENTFDSAMHALHKLLEQPLQTRQGEIPAVLLLLDGLNEVRGNVAPLVQEINELNRMAGVRILATSRSAVTELELDTATLAPLNTEDVEKALGRNGLLLPRSQEVMQLLRTPLILSIYIQASEGGKQLDIENVHQLMDAYMHALLEKEMRQLPENSPLKWQIDAALNFVLPAIAIEAKQKHTPFSQEQLLQVVDSCWRTIHSRRFRKAYPRWIGHSGDIRSGAENGEAWFGIVIHSLLWQRLGLLTKDDSGRYRIYHQMVAEHLASRRIPMVTRRKWVLALTALLLCAAVAAGYHQAENRSQQQLAEAQIQEVLELGAAGYVEYGELYRQLYNLLTDARNGEAENFQASYDRVLQALQRELERTPSEETEARQAEATDSYNQMRITWGTQNNPYEYEILTELLDYPDRRAAFYAEQLPLLKTWTESETLQSKNANYADVFLALLEADANLAAEMYHRAVGIHLTGRDSVWLGNMNGLVAMIPELDAHRTTSVQEDRGQMLSTLNAQYLKALGEYEAQRATLNAYIRNLAEAVQSDTLDLQTQLQQISENLKQDGLLADAADIDAVITELESRQALEGSLISYIENNAT